MPENRSCLTVFFDPPFWVGVLERISDGKLEAAKITFGAEPKDYEVYDYLQKNWSKLRFSPSVDAGTAAKQDMNPKRRQRAISAQLACQGGSTKSQQALALQREVDQTAHRAQSSQEKEAEKARRFAMRQEKRKEKRRGH